MVLFAALVVILIVTTWLVVGSKELSLYVLFLASYTQNFVIPFLHTHGYIGLELARALVLFKDVLLLELFLWSVMVLFEQFRPPWPSPLKPLLLLTFYCIFRFMAGAVFFDDGWTQGLNQIRIIFFPLEILVVIMVVTAQKPEFGRRFLRNMAYVLSVLAVVALGIFVWAPRDFWVENANIAVLQSDVKGNTEYALDFDQGLSMSGTMQGRETFGFLSAFRAIGTFGEALALSFSMAVPVLLFSLYYKKTVVSVLSLTVAAAALCLSLTRSAWIFCGVIVIYVLLRRRRYRELLAAGALVLALMFFFPPLADFAQATVTNITPAADNADSEHAEGILWFYTRGFTDPGNILGKGMRPEAQSIPESGYAYLLEHFGALAYGSFLWFCFSLYRQLGEVGTRLRTLSVLAQGIPLGILIVMHFSYYPFSLPTFMSLWYIVGLCLSDCLLSKGEPGQRAIQVKGQTPRLQPV